MTKIKTIEVYDEDYAITPEDDDEMYRLKSAIFSLPAIQRKIFLAYTEIGTYAGTAREFGVSTPTIKSYLKTIKKNIMDYDN